MSVGSARGVVVVASADPSVCGSIARQFERAGYSTVETASGEDALGLASDGKALLVVLDLDELEDMSGFEVYHGLRQTLDGRLVVILFSGTRTHPSDRLAGLLMGADDYVTKPFEPGEILARAQRLLPRASSPAPPGEPLLTDRELQVLRLLAEGFGQDRIAKELFISPKTVGTHIQRILTKFGVHSRTEAVALAYRHGLIESERLPET